MSDTTLALNRELFILEDENNPNGSKSESVWPKTTLDQVFDNTSPKKKSLRDIIEDLKQEIVTGGLGNIVFPVTTVNGMSGEVVITKKHLGLGNVDNTPDIQKPLSDPQRAAILSLLENYEQNVDLTELYNHLRDTNNPHGVTLEMLDQGDELKQYVLRYIIEHNSSNTSHQDIRNSIEELSNTIGNANDEHDRKINTALANIELHYRDDAAHSQIFSKKEDVINKANDFTTVDNQKYPSTNAVVQYVTQVATEIRGEINTSVKSWIDDIFVVNSRNDLPPASEEVFRKAYFIKNGNGNHDEIAICRYNKVMSRYSWDISEFSTYSKHNPDHFTDTPKGLSINTSTIAGELVKEGSMTDGIKDAVTDVLYNTKAMIRVFINSEGELEMEVDDQFDIPGIRIDEHGDLMVEDNGNNLSTLLKNNCSFIIKNGELYLVSKDPSITDIGRANLKNYYTKKEIDSFNFAGHLKIVPGSVNGTIRYYINNDMDTMSEDINITGIRQLAFMDKVNSDTIEDNSIQSNHIGKRVIGNKHISHKSIEASNMKAAYKTIFGNVEDSTGDTVREIPINYFVELLTPMLKSIIETTITESDEIKNLIRELIKSSTP